MLMVESGGAVRQASKSMVGFHSKASRSEAERSEKTRKAPLGPSTSMLGLNSRWINRVPWLMTRHVCYSCTSTLPAVVPRYSGLLMPASGLQTAVILIIPTCIDRCCWGWG